MKEERAILSKYEDIRSDSTLQLRDQLHKVRRAKSDLIHKSGHELNHKACRCLEFHQLPTQMTVVFGYLTGRVVVGCYLTIFNFQSSQDLIHLIHVYKFRVERIL